MGPLPRFFPDTNVLVDFGRDATTEDRLERARAFGTSFAIAPPALIELTRGLVKAGNNHFANDRRVFVWLAEHQLEILPLPYPFMAQLLRSTIRNGSGVTPDHYRELINAIRGASDFQDFISKAAGTVWRDIHRADAIHNAELDKELDALGTLARKNLGAEVARRLSMKFGVPGCRPNPVIVERKFSAAFEFVQCCMRQIALGANPRKNNPGLYTDFQLLFYLGDPNLQFLTKERFGGEIKNSPQRTRIVGLDSLPQ